jgi:hypothetical protein
MRTIILALVIGAATFAPAEASEKIYCGRITCADVFDGCQVTDGNVNPIVMDRGGRPTKMSPGLGKAVENLAFECACVVGHVELGSDPRGGTYAYFTNASSAYKIPESKCSSGGV